MNLSSPTLQNRLFLEKLLTDAKTHLQYFSELSGSSLDELLSPKGKTLHDSVQDSGFAFGEDPGLFENSGGNLGLQDDESKKEELRKILKIYQIENEANPEENIPQGGYNPRRTAGIKRESNLMKELALFLEENRPRIETEIIDFSKETRRRETEVGVEAKTRINLNMFLKTANNSMFIKKENQ